MSKTVPGKGKFPYRIDHKAPKGLSPLGHIILLHKYLPRHELILSGCYFWRRR